MPDVLTIQLVACLVLGAAGVALVIGQYVRNRRRENVGAVKFLTLGLIIVPVLLILVSMYIGQLWISVTGVTR
jgi:FtsH-binding integral membrane protein